MKTTVQYDTPDFQLYWQVAAIKVPLLLLKSLLSLLQDETQETLWKPQRDTDIYMCNWIRYIQFQPVETCSITNDAITAVWNMADGAANNLAMAVILNLTSCLLV